MRHILYAICIKDTTSVLLFRADTWWPLQSAGFPLWCPNAKMAVECSGRNFKCHNFIVHFRKQDDLGVHFLRLHGVLSKSVEC